MLTNIPVYSAQNGVHFVNIYTEDEDGTFRRTQDEPLRLLRDDITGISSPQGELVSHKFDRQERHWDAPTVSFHYGRPQSLYHFLRERIAKNKFYVFSKPTLSGRLSKFNLHELKLKPAISTRKLAILKEKYTESIDLWLEEAYLSRQQSNDNISNNSTNLDAPVTNNNKILRSTELPNGPGSHELPMSLSAMPAEKSELDIDAQDFIVYSNGVDFNPGQIIKRSSKSQENKQHSHFLLRFLFDRE